MFKTKASLHWITYASKENLINKNCTQDNSVKAQQPDIQLKCCRRTLKLISKGKRTEVEFK